MKVKEIESKQKVEAMRTQAVFSVGTHSRDISDP